jgi:hypothetical protein
VRLSGAALFSLGLALVAAYAVYTASRWPLKAALFPLTMGIPLLAVAAVQTLAELREPVIGEGPLGRVVVVFAWMAAFIALVLLAGFPIAVPLFVFFYLVVESGEKLAVSLVLAAAAWGVFHLLFERLLHFPFETGLIREWFR